VLSRGGYERPLASEADRALVSELRAAIDEEVRFD
jgi:hypothetical protein